MPAPPEAETALGRRLTITAMLRRMPVGQRLLWLLGLQGIAMAIAGGLLVKNLSESWSFTRAELDGLPYLSAMRQTMTLSAQLAAGREEVRQPLADQRTRIDLVEAELARMGVKAPPSAALQEALAQLLSADALGRGSATASALETARANMVVVANASNLILDPELSRHYTGALVALHYPELLQGIAATSHMLREATRRGEADTEVRVRLLSLEGRLEGLGNAVAADIAEAVRADPRLLKPLEERHGALQAALEEFRWAAARMAEPGLNGRDAVNSVAEVAQAAEWGLMAELDRSWNEATAQLLFLLQERLHALQRSMALNLGFVLFAALLALWGGRRVARSIARPLASLSSTVAEVQRTGNRLLRAKTLGEDETSRLAKAFNDMLSELDSQQKAQTELAASGRAARAQSELLSATPIPLIVTSWPGHDVLHVNDPGRDWLASEGENLWEAALELPARQALFESLARDGGVDEFEVLWRHAGTEGRWALLSARLLDFQDQRALLTTVTPIQNLKQLEHRIRDLAEHDGLTGLANRALCVERLRLALQQARRRGHALAVMFIDLDRFKHVNDSLGHAVGDGLLRSVAERLGSCVREVDTLCRLGGDEFVIVLSEVGDAHEVAQIVNERVIPSIRTPHAVGGRELQVSCSVGIAMYPQDGDDVDTLMRHADAAMYQAKAAGKDGSRFFSAEMTARAQARLAVENALRGALQRGELHMAWQPRICAKTGALKGVEGLLRWQHPELGHVSPADFIPVAEETGLIVPIGAWVLEQACRMSSGWAESGRGPLAVSVNLSARQLRDIALVPGLASAISRHKPPRDSIELELTESMIMGDGEGHLRQMHALRALGVALSIDDFGTGYSSLAYLSRFPIDKLKIDRSFVRDMVEAGPGLTITTAIVRLGHALGLQVVAEGVETTRQAQLLREAGCNELQGYLFGRPMPLQALQAWADERAGSHLAQANTSAKADDMLAEDPA